VGLVEADQVMRVSDHAALAAMPGVELINIDALFDRLRAEKSREEVAGLEEAAAIADDCFQALLDMARPGLRENEICGRLSDVAIASGADELLFLTMSGAPQGEAMHAMIRAPGDHRLSTVDPFVFSIEVSGPSGFWVELARVVAFGGAGPDVAKTADLVHASVKVALPMLRAGVNGLDIQAALETPFDATLHEVSGWSGHAIGHDVIEGPLIGRGADPAIPFETGMALALHPMFNWRDRPLTGYVADTYVIEAHGPRVLSRWPLELYKLNR
jgi:Xaa-Pro aminopeptidase